MSLAMPRAGSVPVPELAPLSGSVVLVDGFGADMSIGRFGDPPGIDDPLDGPSPEEESLPVSGAWLLLDGSDPSLLVSARDPLEEQPATPSASARKTAAMVRVVVGLVAPRCTPP